MAPAISFNSVPHAALYVLFALRATPNLCATKRGLHFLLGSNHPRAVEIALRVAKKHGLVDVVCTSQSGCGRGNVSVIYVSVKGRQMLESISARGNQ